MAIDSDVDKLWHGQESPKTTVTKNGDSTVIGLHGGRHRVILNRGQRSWISSEGYGCRIDPNTPTWDFVDSILELWGE